MFGDPKLTLCFDHLLRMFMLLLTQLGRPFYKTLQTVTEIDKEAFLVLKHIYRCLDLIHTFIALTDFLNVTYSLSLVKLQVKIYMFLGPCGYLIT